MHHYLTDFLCSTFLLIGIFSCSAYDFEELDIALQDYDKRVRPYRKKAPVEVKVQLFLLAFGPISTKTFTFESAIFLRQWWTDPRINIQNESITLNGNPSVFLWVPDLFIPNT